MSNSAPRKSGTIRLLVQRGLGSGETSVSCYDLPNSAAASLLDGLRWVRGNLDDTLAFRYSCINANACKECMMRFDGKVVYACVARLRPDAEHIVEPLSNKPRVRDLITEVAPGKERLFVEDDDE